MGLEKQGSRPTGWIGKVAGLLMNKFHTSVYVAYFKDNMPGANAKIMDVGCGGGGFLEFLHRADDRYLLYGLDHSPGMIALCSKIILILDRFANAKLFRMSNTVHRWIVFFSQPHSVSV